ncbi:polysaccharide deacetylase family protein [Bizionia saleffrena]|uniref:Polysaccharide deacetylase family protein n=1 Tax=Bizionia saleffrena TaxID=291189 RepID=A0A8H2LES3_9FLAO|nr:polysaccharide deacetylase family protein [Bizionia saleffrena]TYB69460.1 polysaccharide deacetylase family protein [Bizionia saleffrena]
MRKRLRTIFLHTVGSIKRAKPGIHIINSHYVSAKEVNEEYNYRTFDAYLKDLNTYASFINLEEATSNILQNNLPKKKVLITFTFDDGFEECYTIIAPLLEKYNCRGAFFINANYINSDKSYQQGFNERVAITTKKPMTWIQVIDLHERGHLIGSHNLDHSNFANLSIAEIDFQLKKNKEILEEKLNYKCEYFAWTYGQLQHFPLEALKLTEKYHKYIFSGTNYRNYFSYSGRVLNRRHLESNWPKSHLKYFLSFKKKH